MIDWHSSMQQTFEFYKVDPNTWMDSELINTVNSATINRDLNADTLGSATFDIDGSIDECYIRVYIRASQNGDVERHPLGTFLVQTPTYTYNGRKSKYTLDAYTPLLELKENPMPLGYSLLKGTNIIESAYRIARDGARAPVIKPENNDTLNDDFVAETSETKLNFITDLISNANNRLDLDEMGRIAFAPVIETDKLQPSETFNDDNSSILLPDISVTNDIFGIPNRVTVVYSKNKIYYEKTITNDDPNSVLSTVNRGRVIEIRDENPNLYGLASEAMIEEYAKKLLKQKSKVSRTITFSHGFLPNIRIGDCIELNYERAGIRNKKAQIVSQSIECKQGCIINETAIYTDSLWEG